MKAVLLEETRQIVVREVPDAEMRETTDVLLRITTTAICGTDLHFYESRMRGIEGGVIGTRAARRRRRSRLSWAKKKASRPVGGCSR